jgi:putative FmdB family regulatory protein
MPTYEYVCKSCGHLFEIVQSMRDDTLTECPECGGELRKVFAPPAISFKGSGFYATDHGKKGSKSAGEKKAEAASGSGSSDSSSSDSGSTETSGSSEKKDAKPAAETKKDAPKTSSPAPSKDSSDS